LLLLLIFSSLASSLAHSQSQPGSRIAQPIDERIRVTLTGNVHPLAQARCDLGAVPDSFPAERMFLLLQRTGEREAALRQFLHDAHRPGSPSYHKWLTPEQFAELYGPDDADVAAVTGWLQKHGFSVARVTKGKTAIEFSGTAGQLRETFHTEIHIYAVKGEQHYANNLDPQVPAALAPVIAGITPMNDFQPTSYLRDLGKAVYDRETHKFVPQWTFPSGQDALELSPGDFALQYDLNPLYAAGITGTGVTIGLIGASNVDPTVVATYRSFFGLPPNPLNVVVDGLDPGENGAFVESYLDVEEAGAVAPGATITLYTSAGTSLQSGLYLAAQRAVDDDVAAVLSTSYGTCEQYLGSAGNQFWNALWEQAAAQGQTSFVSAGDGGPAGCDNFNNPQPAQYGIAMNGFSSTPWNVSVGGTDFYYTSYNGTSAAQQTELETYCRGSADNSNREIAIRDDAVSRSRADGIKAVVFPRRRVQRHIGKIAHPVTGNALSCLPGRLRISCCAGSIRAIGSINARRASARPAAAGDDVGSVRVVDAAVREIQSERIIPRLLGNRLQQRRRGKNGRHRIPSSPAMAGIMALINQKYGPQGQADFILYPLAAQHPSAFHDVTVGSNIVPCQSGTPNCTLSTATDNTKGYDILGYYAGPGYDLATGLGSVDANVLFTNWNSLTFKSTSTSLSLSQTSFKHGTLVTVNVGVSGSGGTPTGGVELVTTSTPQNSGLTLLTLQGGAASANVNNLPGGQYKVRARYGGDNFFASSTSNPLSVNVTPEASNLSLFGSYYLYTNNSTGVLTNGGSYPFGTSIAVEAQAVGVNAPAASTDGIATGTVTFTDAASLGTVSSGPLSMGSASTAVWVPTAFSAGSHSISASYSGDASFNASSSSTPLNFTITKATPGAGLSSTSSAIAPGQNVTLVVTLLIYSSAPPPTGTATFYSGTTALGTATVVQSPPTWPYIPYSTATLNTTNLPLGTDSITAQYSGDANYQAATSSPVQVIVAVPQGPVATLTATPNASSMLPTQDLIVTANVAGVSGKPTPTGYIGFNAYGPGGGYTASCTLVNGSCSQDFGSSYWSPGTVTVNVSYSGDATYAGTSTVVSVTMLNVFTMTAASSVSFAAGATTGNTAALTVTPLNGFTGLIYFACTIAYYPPGAQHLPTCYVPASVNVTGGSAVTAAMIISSTGPTTVSRAAEIKGPRWLAAQFLTFFAGILVVRLPLRKRVRPRGTSLFLLIALMGSVALVSCGGGGSSGGGKTIPGTTPGTYKFMVDGAYTPNTRTPEPLFYTQPQVFIVNVAIQ
jgi:hypothetical protein